MAYPLQWFKEQFTDLQFPKVNLEGRTILVTGSNTGLGLEAARHFAKLKCSRLILAVRSTDKGENAKRSILYSHGVDGQKTTVEVWQLDMASFASVKAFAQRCERELSRLDIALLNAGLTPNGFKSTQDGYEQSLQVNCLSTGYLALLLLPLLRKTSKVADKNLKPHLTIVASDAHFFTKFPEGKDAHPLEVLNDKSRFREADRYNVTKLLDVWIGRGIGKLVQDQSVVVNTVNPALCWSELGRDMPIYIRGVLYTLRTLLARSTEMGSRTYMWAALSDTPRGAFTSSCHVEDISYYAQSQEGTDAEAKVWAGLKEIWIKLDKGLGQVLN